MNTPAISNPPKHPAPYSLELIPILEGLLKKYNSGRHILDPFAGIGRVHLFKGYNTLGLEIEPEWSNQHPQNILGDATNMMFGDLSFDAIVVSPSYGNRMADSHDAKDISYRRTYKHLLGHDLQPNNSGAMQWGPAYRELHQKAWAECERVLLPGGLFLLNCKNHVRKGREVKVTLWHILTLKKLGFDVLEYTNVGTPGFGFGQNRELRCVEQVITLRKKMR